MRSASGKLQETNRIACSKLDRSGEISSLSYSLLALLVICLLDILFDTENGGSAFLRNVGVLLSDYAMSHAVTKSVGTSRPTQVVSTLP
jgi:hypothetical protein